MLGLRPVGLLCLPPPLHIHIRPGHQLVDDDPGARLPLVLGPCDPDELLLSLGLGNVLHLGNCWRGLLARRLELGRGLARLGGLARFGFLRGLGAPSYIGVA